MSDVKKVKMMTDGSGNFTSREVNADNVGQLVTELGSAIPSGAAIAINGVQVTNEAAIENGQFISAVVSNKTGG
jgi:hypothetical protein